MGESSCSGACVEPIKDTDLSELLPEREALTREREFVDIGIPCDLEFYWFDVLQKSTASVGKKQFLHFETLPHY